MGQAKQPLRTLAVGCAAFVGLTLSGAARAQSIDTGFDLAAACIAADLVLQGGRVSDLKGALGMGLCMGYIDGAVQAQALWADAKPFCVSGLKRKDMVHSFASWAAQRTNSITENTADTFNAFMWERHACNAAHRKG